MRTKTYKQYMTRHLLSDARKHGFKIHTLQSGAQQIIAKGNAGDLRQTITIWPNGGIVAGHEKDYSGISVSPRSAAKAVGIQTSF